MKLKFIQKKENYLSFLILLVGILFVSGCTEQQQQTAPFTEKIIFTLPAKLPDATEGVSYSYSFCEPDSARSLSTCGGNTGTPTNPTGGNPQYGFSELSGIMPSGITLETNGLFRGVPALRGNYSFGVCITDLKEVVCKNTSIAVKPAPEIFDVKINSFSCAWTVKTGDYNIKSDCVRIISKGTAQGPIGARVELPILSWSDDKFDCGAWTLKTGALIAVGSTCVRKEGQPETTNFTVDTEGNECPVKNYFNNDRTYSVKIYKNNDIYPEKEDSKTTPCQ